MAKITRVAFAGLCFNTFVVDNLIGGGSGTLMCYFILSVYHWTYASVLYYCDILRDYLLVAVDGIFEIYGG